MPLLPSRLASPLRAFLVAVAALPLLAAGALHAQNADAPRAGHSPAPARRATARTAAAAPRALRIPFGVGERATYDVKFGPIKVGTGSMEIMGIENVRGMDAFHSVFRVKGGTIGYHVNDVLESWMHTTTLSSLRFAQSLQEGRKDRERKFEIFPDRSVFIEEGKPEEPSVERPLDDGSFLYFLRTVPLEVGEVYEFNRYFRPDRNPVKLRVVRRERIKVPAGTFDAIVIMPVIKTKGIFAESARTEVWLSDDANKVLLQMKSALPFGSLSLYLKSYQAGTPR
jgi:hypothetical protein